MGFRVNISARIKRHSRILKDNILNNRDFPNKEVWIGYKFVYFIIILLLPIYPSLSSFVHSNTELDFYRWDIDESSIIWSYFWDKDVPISEFSDSFLSISTPLNDDRDLSGTNEILYYEVKPGESISSIAYKFKVSNQSIYDNNNFSKNHIIHPWDIIKIPPVSWLIHQIKSWETIFSIAEKYGVNVNKIMEQNLIALEDKIIEWRVLIIPGAVKRYSESVDKNLTKNYFKWNSYSNDWWYSFADFANSQYVNTKWAYKLTPKPRYHIFYSWNCTWYVAKYKTVKWWWNAKDWLRNAKAKWFPTWNKPLIWSIVVFYGRWYNPRHGHVWIVMDVKNDHIIVNDMNYRKLWEITYRKVPINDRAITWYIYID